MFLTFSWYSCPTSHSFLFKISPHLPDPVEGRQGTPGYMTVFCIMPTVLLIFGGIVRSYKYSRRAIEWNIKKNKLNNKSNKIKTQRRFSLLLLEKIVFSHIFLYFYIGFHVGSTKILWNSLNFCARQVQEIPQIYWESVVWISHPSVFQAKEAWTSIQTSAAYRSAIVSVLRIVEMKTNYSLLIAGWIIITLLKLGLDS